MNQAIGRVIRHRRDFGCVVLCDARFAEERNRQSLSLWARPFVRECSGFGKVAADLARFFKVLQLFMLSCALAMRKEHNTVYQLFSADARSKSTVTGTSMIRFD